MLPFILDLFHEPLCRVLEQSPLNALQNLFFVMGWQVCSVPTRRFSIALFHLSLKAEVALDVVG
jgi:hypothetical protein